MKKFFKKVIIVSIAGSILGGLLFYVWKNQYALSNNQIIVEEDLKKENEKADLKKMEIDKKISNGRAETINYVEKNINKISPEKPAFGLLWQPVKIWFIDDRNFYVDYKDETSNTRRLLIFKTMTGPAAEYEILGFFIPGESGWVLKFGKDIEEVISLKLYEKNEETGEWAAK